MVGEGCNVVTYYYCKCATDFIFWGVQFTNDVDVSIIARLRGRRSGVVDLAQQLLLFSLLFSPMHALGFPSLLCSSIFNNFAFSRIIHRIEKWIDFLCVHMRVDERREG